MELLDFDSYYNYLILLLDKEYDFDEKIFRLARFNNVYILSLIIYIIFIILSLIYKNYVFNIISILFEIIFVIYFLKSYRSKNCIFIIVFSLVSQILDIISTIIAGIIYNKNFFSIHIIDANPFLVGYIKIHPVYGTILFILNKVILAFFLSLPLIIYDYINNQKLVIKDDKSKEMFLDKKIDVNFVFQFINKFSKISITKFISDLDILFTNRININKYKKDREVSFQYIAFKNHPILLKLFFNFLNNLFLSIIFIFYAISFNNIIAIVRIINLKNINFVQLKNFDQIYLYFIIGFGIIITIYNLNILFINFKLKKYLKNINNNKL